MDGFLKWVVIIIGALLVWKWWQTGIGANFSLGPQYGYGNGYPTNTPGYTFTGPGMIFGFNPDTFKRYGQTWNLADF